MVPLVAAEPLPDHLLPYDDGYPEIQRDHCWLRGITLRDRAIIYIGGDLDLAYRDQVTDALAALTAPLVIVDLSHLVFIDASGLSALLIARRRLAGRGSRLQLRGAHGLVRRVFAIAGLVDAFGL